MALKDTFFISHGSSTISIDDSIPAWEFLTSWKEVLPQRFSSILVISGHWDTDVPTVNVVDHNKTIYDYYGFPKVMYKVRNLALCLMSCFVPSTLLLPFLLFTITKCLIGNPLKNTLS